MVDSIDHAEKCVEFLKNNNLGTATFIGLDKFKVRQKDQDQFNCPPNSKRLYDLVRFKHEKYANVFYSQLRNTLVTNDIKMANKIAFESPN